MKKVSLFVAMAAMVASSMFMSCADMDTTETAVSTETARATQTWSLWDGLDNYNTSVFNKANW